MLCEHCRPAKLSDFHLEPNCNLEHSSASEPSTVEVEQPQGLLLFRFDAMDLDLDDLEVAQSGVGHELLVTLLMNVKPIRMKPGDRDVVALCSCPIVSFHCSNVFQCFSIVLKTFYSIYILHMILHV